jgi:hypothetical protein
MSVRTQLGLGLGSLEGLRTGLHVRRPSSLRDLLRRYAEPIILDEPLVTPDGVPLGGHHAVRLDRNGGFSHVGHMRATGFPSFNFGVRTVFQRDAATAVVAASGHVAGTVESGDRQVNWRQSGRNPAVALNWLAFKNSTAQTQINRDADWFADVGDVLAFAASVVGGAVVAGGTGACLMLGIEAADAAGLDEHVGVGGLAGLAVVGATLVIFSPAAIVPALVVGGALGTAIELALEHRPMTDEEFRFADRVFHGTLPRNRIRLTNMLGLGSRPFVVPGVGDAILVNLGEGFRDPTRYRGSGDPSKPHDRQPGQLFIHEMVHVWQVDVATFVPGLLCHALLNQSTTLGGDMAIYQYGPAAGTPWSAFNLEQQGKIVEQWFAGAGRQSMTPPQLAAHGLETAAMIENEAINPYFRYIRDNIRQRIA